MAMGVTEKLAAHAFNVRYEDMPQEVIEKAKDCLLDQIGVELIGSTLDWNKIAYRYVVDMGGRAESTIVNYGTKAPVWTLRLSTQRSVRDASSTMWGSVPEAT